MDNTTRDLYQKIVSKSDDFLAYYSPDYRVLAANHAYAKAHNFDIDDIIGKPLDDIFTGKLLEALRKNMKVCLTGQTVFYETAYDYPGCGFRNIKVTYKPDFDDEGKVQGLIVNVTDITFLKQQEFELQRLNEELEKLCRIDGLTQVQNRIAYDERLRYEIASSKRSQTSFCLLMIDVDHFKKFNDFYGHHAGDVVLKKVASILHSSIKRETDFLARYGGEEFVLILPKTTAPEASLMANEILQQVYGSKIQHAFSRASGFLTISIGVAEYSEGDDELGLFKKVDSALYEAKANGRNTVMVYQPE